MAFPKQGMYIDIRAKRLLSVVDVSRRFIRLVNETDAIRLFEDEGTLVVRWDYDQRITPVQPDEEVALREEIIGHITDATDQFELTQFSGGYCFIASEWQDAAGGSILVLHCQH